MIIAPGVVQFFSYLRNFSRFYGKDIVTVAGFVTLYLDYDTDYNPVRQYIIEKSGKDKIQMNRDCLNFILSNSENGMNQSFLNAEEYFGKDICISQRLDSILSSVINSETITEVSDIHEFMYHVLSEKNLWFRKLMKNYFGSSFNVDFVALMRRLKSRVGNSKYISRTCFEVPGELAKYAKVIDGKREDFNIATRDDTKDTIWNVFPKSFANKVVLISEYYDMPEEFIFNMAYQVEHDRTEPLREKNYFIHIDFQYIVVKYFDDRELISKLKELVDAIISIKNKKQFIIYLQNINVLMVSREKGYNYLYLFIPIFDDKELKVIFNISESEYNMLMVDWRLARNLYGIELDEPIKEEIVPTIMPSIFRSSIYHGVLISHDMIETAKLFAKALDPDEFIPGYKNVIDFAMGVARSNGRHEVLEDDFIENFKVEFHEYEKQSEEFKELVAYHEAGHFLVSRFCEHFKAVYPDLISVVSTRDFGGANIMDFDPSMVKDYGYEFYLEDLAMTLAGRASEELFLGGISSGAESDLQQATILATKMVSTLGLDKSNNFAIKGNENLRSEKSMNEVSDKVNEIMEEAYELAKEMLTKYEEYVHVLAELLLERKIVSRKEILSYEVMNDGGIVTLVREGRKEEDA